MNENEIREELQTIRAATNRIETLLDGGPPPPPPPPPGGDYEPVLAGEVFNHPGELFVSHAAREHCTIQYQLPSRTYSAFRISFDLYIPEYADAEKTHYVLLWAQLSDKWRDMLGYLLSVPSRSCLRFSSNEERIEGTNESPKLIAGVTYRVEFSAYRNGIGYVVTGGGKRWERTFARVSNNVLVVNKPFVCLGNNYHTADGPEAITDGFVFSNVASVWTP